MIEEATQIDRDTPINEEYINNLWHKAREAYLEIPGTSPTEAVWYADYFKKEITEMLTSKTGELLTLNDVALNPVIARALVKIKEDAYGHHQDLYLRANYVEMFKRLPPEKDEIWKKDLQSA